MNRLLACIFIAAGLLSCGNATRVVISLPDVSALKTGTYQHKQGYLRLLNSNGTPAHADYHFDLPSGDTATLEVISGTFTFILGVGDARQSGTFLPLMEWPAVSGTVAANKSNPLSVLNDPNISFDQDHDAVANLTEIQQGSDPEKTFALWTQPGTLIAPISATSLLVQTDRPTRLATATGVVQASATAAAASPNEWVLDTNNNRWITWSVQSFDSNAMTASSTLTAWDTATLAVVWSNANTGLQQLLGVDSQGQAWVAANTNATAFSLTGTAAPSVTLPGPFDGGPSGTAFLNGAGTIAGTHAYYVSNGNVILNVDLAATPPGIAWMFNDVGLQLDPQVTSSIVVTAQGNVLSLGTSDQLANSRGQGVWAIDAAGPPWAAVVTTSWGDVWIVDTDSTAVLDPNGIPRDPNTIAPPGVPLCEGPNQTVLMAVEGGVPSAGLLGSGLMLLGRDGGVVKVIGTAFPMATAAVVGNVAYVSGCTTEQTAPSGDCGGATAQVVAVQLQ